MSGGWLDGADDRLNGYNFAASHGGVVRTNCVECGTWIAVTPSAYARVFRTGKFDDSYDRRLVMCRDCGGY